MPIVDRIRFLMPKSREYQFAAMAVAQACIEHYDERPRMQGVPAGYDDKVELQWEIVMPQEDWLIFQQAGLELQGMGTLSFDRPLLADADVEVDMREHILEDHRWRTDHHLAQIYGALIGTETRVTPKLRQVQPGTVWYQLWEVPIVVSTVMPMMVPEALLTAGDGLVGGIVGHAGWGTYLAASMGLPVIEVKPPERPLNFMSKWSHKTYRMVDGAGDVEKQVYQALEDLRRCSAAQVPHLTAAE